MQYDRRHIFPSETKKPTESYGKSGRSLITLNYIIVILFVILLVMSLRIL